MPESQPSPPQLNGWGLQFNTVDMISLQIWTTGMQGTPLDCVLCVILLPANALLPVSFLS